MHKRYIFLIICFIVSCKPNPIITRTTNTTNYNSVVHDDIGDLIINNLFPTNGNIPLVLLMANVPENESNFQEIGVYQDYYSSRFTYNAQEYFHKVSNGLFTFEFLGVWGPYNIPTESTKTIADITVASLSQAVGGENAEKQFNLKQFDTDFNGIITQNELLIVVVNNGSFFGGAARWVDAKIGDLYIEALVATHGSHANLATITHEIAHLLGASDLYGSNCNSINLTLMSCTIFGASGDDTVHLDPWHKMHLGWIKPKVISVPYLKNKACYSITIPQYSENDPFIDDSNPLLVVDSNLNLNEYFIIEFRNGIWHDNIPSYEKAVSDIGIAIWSIRTDENGKLLNVPSIVENEKWDKSIWTYGSSRDAQWSTIGQFGLQSEKNIIIPEFTPSNLDRSSFLWGPGVVEPRYQDGTSANFILEINDFDNNSYKTEICIKSTLK